MPKLVRTQMEFEGRTFERLVVVEEEGVSPWGTDANLSIVGQAVPRVDGAAKVTGQAVYTADVNLPGMLYARILRSPHPHAKLTNLDTSRAEAHPAVRAVLSRQNAPPIGWHNDSFLFDDTLRFAGDEVAAVAAIDEDTTLEALTLIKAEYELLPFVLDLEGAMCPESPKLHPGGNVAGGKPTVYRRGDLDEGLAAAEEIFEARFTTQVALHNCLESHGCVAMWEGEHLTVWESTQHVFAVRDELCASLGLPAHQVRVIASFIGGGFGSKIQTNKYSVIAALLARMAGRPVRLMYDRREENLAAGNRNNTVQYLRIGARKNGSLTGIHYKSIAGIGAYGVGGSELGGPARELYHCPNVFVEQYSVYVNTGPACAFRAPGYVEATFALESAVDMLAAKLGIDPLQFRLINYAEKDPVSGQPYTQKLLREAYHQGAAMIGWGQPLAPSTGSRRRGRGMGTQIWGGAGGPPAYATIKLNPDGTALLFAGTQDLGTGTRTLMTQIAAEELGLRVSDVKTIVADTDQCPYGPPSAGSMSAPSVGPAVRSAARDARTQFVNLVGDLLDIPADRLRTGDSMVWDVENPEQRRSFREIGAQLGSFMVLGRGSRGPNPKDLKIRTFGVQFAEVEVDLETGEIDVQKIVAVHQVGRVLNAKTFGSQVEGGIIQGLGFCFTENRVVDLRTGLVLNPNLENYKVPTALDVPPISHQMIDVADPVANSIGAKGIGEPPIIPTPAAIANAVSAATGFRFQSLPITRDKMLRLAEERQ